MLSHALLLGRYLDWLLWSGRARLLAETYPVFARSAGKGGLDAYYAVAGIQIVAGLAFLLVSMLAGQRVLAGVIAGLAAVAWPAMHYGSGFGALEAQVLRSTSDVSPDVAAAFIRWNGPVHLFHSVALTIGLAALLSVPLGAGATRPRR